MSLGLPRSLCQAPPQLRSCTEGPSHHLWVQALLSAMAIAMVDKSDRKAVCEEGLNAFLGPLPLLEPGAGQEGKVLGCKSRHFIAAWRGCCKPQHIGKHKALAPLGCAARASGAAAQHHEHQGRAKPPGAAQRPGPAVGSQKAFTASQASACKVQRRS